MADAPKQSQVTEFRFLPLSIRLETLGGIATPLVLRGTPLPTKRVETFSTASDDQKSVEVKVLIGESSLAKKCQTLGTFQIPGIPPAPRGKPQIKLVFSVERNCSVQVKASLDGSSMEAECVLVPPTDLLTPESITKLRTEAKQSKQEDEQKVSLIEARLAGETAVKKAEGRLQTFHEKKTGVSDPEAVKRAIAQVGQALESEDAGRIREATQVLNSRLGQGFDFETIFGASAFNNIFTQQPSRQTHQKPVVSRASYKSATKSKTLAPQTRYGRCHGCGHRLESR